MADRHHPARFLRLDELALEELDQRVAPSGMGGVAAQLDDAEGGLGHDVHPDSVASRAGRRKRHLGPPRGSHRTAMARNRQFPHGNVTGPRRRVKGRRAGRAEIRRMTRTFIGTAVVAAIAGLLPAAALAAPAASAAAPIRTVTFAVDVSSRSEQRVATSGLGGFDPKTGSAQGAAGGASVRTQSVTSGNAVGTIVVDVIAVTADGLVVDVAENVSGRVVPKARIGITTVGTLLYDPNKVPLTPEAVMLLQLLNRSLVEGHDADGASWTDDTSVRGFKDVTSFRILSSTNVTPGPILHMELERSVASSGAHPFELLTTGRLDYNEQRAVPLSVTLREHRTSVNVGGQQVQDDSVYTYKLVTDSLAKT